MSATTPFHLQNPFQQVGMSYIHVDMQDIEIKCRIVEKLLRKRVIGGHVWSIDKTVNYTLPDSEQGRGRQLIENEMIPKAEASLGRYGGGHRDNIHLTDREQAVAYLKNNGGNVPFGFD